MNNTLPTITDINRLVALGLITYPTTPKPPPTPTTEEMIRQRKLKRQRVCMKRLRAGLPALKRKMKRRAK